MKNLNVSMKLLVGFLTIIMFSIILAGVGVYSTTSINSNYVYLINNPIDRHIILQQMQFDFTMMRYRCANFVMNTHDPEFINSTLLPQYQSAYKSFQENYSVYKQNNSSDAQLDPARQRSNTEQSEKMLSMVEEYNRTVEQILAHARAGDQEGANNALKDMIPLAGGINTTIDELISPTTESITLTEDKNVRYTNNIMIVQILLAIACTILALLLAFYISSLISKPLTSFTAFMDKAGLTGDINLTQDDIDNVGKYTQAHDEIGRCIGSTARYIQHMGKINEKLALVAKGDLTVEFELLSDKDTIGSSMRTVLESLNSIFAEIQASSDQVSTGSKHVADGAQSLAEGSTEQAASIQELSGTIAEIAEMTKANAETTEKTSRLSATIKENAEKGSRQMGEMIAAVKDINEASNSISKIIKTIDDIAFQTNILALNAAVEAARAGQHGKGFAVVAEEVRNLASKSAAAAKDTGDMIQNSMEKAELGSRMANETSSSLEEIVNGINESTQLIEDIARSSEEQSLGISQVNVGIEQVAQVVSQNSATAEESAAASQEMSAQSTVLQQLMARFKLKENSTEIRSSLDY